jgi:hypothetical protein
MRRIAITVPVFAFVFVSVFVLTLVSTVYGSGKDESVEGLKARFENARVEDRTQIGVRIAQQQLRNADQLYASGHVDQAQAAVEDLVTYCEKARDAALQTRKHLKNVEIDVRRMAEKLRDIKRTVAFEDQSPIEQAIRRLEDVRTTMLKEMFANDHKKDKK